MKYLAIGRAGARTRSCGTWRNRPAGAKRLECGGFSAAVARPETVLMIENVPPYESAAEDGAVQTLCVMG
jgi:hypothetical protein